MTTIDAKQRTINGVRLSEMRWQIARTLYALERTVTYEEIAHELWGLQYVDYMDMACIRTHIVYLRRLLGPKAILNVKGVGYRWNAENDLQ